MADQGSEGLFSPFLRSRRIRAARPYIRGKVLDMGCGIGALASWVPADLYWGVDIDEPSLALARRRHPRHSFSSSWPAAKPDFDTVVSLAVMEHVPDPAMFLRELAARLSTNPDSRIVCTTPHPLVGRVHGMGAKIGLFSRHASEEHEDLLDKAMLFQLASEAALKPIAYKRFLLGANQLAVFQLGTRCKQ